AFTLGCDDPLKVAYLFTGFMAESARSSLSKSTKIEQCQSMSSFQRAVLFSIKHGLELGN
ncbi:hypothetical protein PN462_12845, partial [Spirulina sp. CS-785/01]|uniref:hypothetical protein n=1 Tax=Spirulina sp. CS-785/01 TaxID=3021716 RepID=UPI00232C3178